MDSEPKSDRDSTGFSRFYKKRRNVYGALLIFVVVIALPTVTVPKLRQRLTARAQAFADAVAGRRPPVVAQVGGNQQPFPEEYKRPEPPPLPQIPQIPQLPKISKVYSATQDTSDQRRSETRSPSKKAPINVTNLPSAKSEEPAEETESTAAIDEPKYQKGKIEQEAYDLLLASNPLISDVVKGNNSSFKLKSWEAAARGEDTFWVRLKLQPQGGPEAEYIWQVKLQSKQVSPLNYNARSIQ